MSRESLNEDVDPRDQRRLIEEFVARRGWSLEHVYEDAGLDAITDLPALTDLLANVADLDRIVVTRLDRLARSVRRLSRMIDYLEDAGVGLVSLSEGLDTSSPSGATARAVLNAVGGWSPGAAPGAKTGWSEKLASFTPSTVVDVGAAEGTHALYECFPAAHHVLIEPLIEFEPNLSAIAAALGAEYLKTAIGDTAGQARIMVNPVEISMSSILRPVRAPDGLVEREVPVTTLDALLEDRAWPPPFGLKVDTEGFEAQVIAGAHGFLEQTQFVLLEVSLGPRFESSASSGELVELMGGRGFEVYDVLHTGSSRLGLHADLLFGRRR